MDVNQEENEIGSSETLPSIVVDTESGSEATVETLSLQGAESESVNLEGSSDIESTEKEECMADPESSHDNRPVRTNLLFAQVTKQIRAQVSMDINKKGILGVVQRVTQAEQERTRLQSQGASREGVHDEAEDSKLDEQAQNQNVNETCDMTILREELLLSITSLRCEFQKEIDRLRTEMRQYCDSAGKRVETKQGATRKPDQWKNVLQKMNIKEEQQFIKKGLDDGKKSRSVPSLVPGKSKVLFRTMTGLTSKSLVSSNLGPRSKSETLEPNRESNNSLVMLDSPNFQVLASQSTKLPKIPGCLSPGGPKHGSSTARKHSKASTNSAAK